MLLLKRDTGANVFLTPVRPITRGGGGGGGGCHMEAAVRMDEGLLAQTNGCRSAAAEDAASSAAAATVAAGGGGGEENRTTPRVSSSNNNGDRLGNSNNSSASGGTGIFSKELISFSLYGKIPRKSKRPWNESLSSKIAEVQDSFKNIPSMLYFSPSSVIFDGIGVYAADTLPKGTMLGPYFGKTVQKEETDKEMHEWLWEVYQDSSLAYFIDASDPKYGNWMNFIQCARNQQEQNLKASQYSGCLYFESVRDVAVGEELLVWYDELQYDIYMGIPVGFRGKHTTTAAAVAAAAANCTGSNSRSSSMTTESYPGSRPSSENSEQDLFISSCPPLGGTSQVATTTGGRHSDTSSASTDDSGISITFENSGGNSGGGGGTGGSSVGSGRVGGSSGGGSTGSLPGDTSPMETFPTILAGEPGNIFQTITPVNMSDTISSTSSSSSSSASGYMTTHLRVGDPLTTLSQPTPLQLPVYMATDGVHQNVTELKTVSAARPRFSFGAVSLAPPTAAVGPPVAGGGGGGVEIGKESGVTSAWTPITGGTYSIVTPGSKSQQQLSPRLTSREGGLLLWPSSGGNSPVSATINTTSVGVGRGGGGIGVRGGMGDKTALLYEMFIRTDDGSRWQCIECKRLFNSQGSLRAHARIHTGERPYKCQYCYRTFCQASTLRSHERLHTGEKPYKCEHCGRAFTQSAGLRSHLKTHRYDS